MADAFAFTQSNLREQLRHLLAGKRQEANLVLERSHVKDVALRDGSLRDGSTYATYIIYGEVGFLIESLTAPYQHVGKEIGKFALRSVSGHIVSRISHNRTHHRIHALLIWSQERHSLLVLCVVIARVDEYA